MDLKAVKTRPAVSQMEEGVLYHDNSNGNTFHICPCGCSQMSYIPTGGRNKYECKADNGRPTLRPVVFNRSCGAHFYLTKGVVKWMHRITRCPKCKSDVKFGSFLNDYDTYQESEAVCKCGWHGWDVLWD